jgi:biopolymer transport protein ExbB
MNRFNQFWQQSDVITLVVAAALLAMSLCAWMLIFWKGWSLRRARQSMLSAIPAFWAAPSMAAGHDALTRADREGVLLPLVVATLSQPVPGTLQADGQPQSQLTRRLREALNGVLSRLRWGQVALACIGSTAPFIGLLGTVWGIYHALLSISAAGANTLDKVSGPVGETLIMTAAGLAVAIPAVLAYNVFGKHIAHCETQLEGFAHDLREMAG